MNAKSNILPITAINQEINAQLSDESVSRALLATTFKGLNAVSMKQAIMEGMIRGFSFKDFLEKKVYAVPFAGKYSLVTSIDYSRSVGMRSGVVGKSAPTFEMENGKIVSCTVTVKRKIGDYIGDYTATVYMDEYSTGTNLWKTKPRTMLAKCFAEGTEVLTDRGFVDFREIRNEKVLQVSENGLEAVEAKPFSMEWCGDMVSYNKTDVDFRVTSNHDMVTTHGKVEAGTIFATSRTRSKHAIVKAIEYQKDDATIRDDEIRILAATIADGNINNNVNVRISVSREKKIAFLATLQYKNMLPRKCAGDVATFDGRMIKTTKDQMQFNFELTPHIKTFVDKKKNININAILTLSQRQARLLVDTWVFFDGNISSSGTKRLYTSNANHLMALQILSVLAGYSISKESTRRTPGARDNFVVVLSDIKSVPLFRAPKDKNSLTSEIVERERVWCVTVPTGKIVVRKNNFSFVCGNCAEMHALRMACPEELAQSYVEEEMEAEVQSPTVTRFTAAKKASDPIRIKKTSAHEEPIKTEYREVTPEEARSAFDDLPEGEPVIEA